MTNSLYLSWVVKEIELSTYGLRDTIVKLPLYVTYGNQSF